MDHAGRHHLAAHHARFLTIVLSTMQRERLDVCRGDDQEQNRVGGLPVDQVWSNLRRRHTSLEMLDPAEFEALLAS